VDFNPQLLSIRFLLLFRKSSSPDDMRVDAATFPDGRCSLVDNFSTAIVGRAGQKL
jgi:hypothetical protein